MFDGSKVNGLLVVCHALYWLLVALLGFFSDLIDSCLLVVLNQRASLFVDDMTGDTHLNPEKKGNRSSIIPRMTTEIRFAQALDRLHLTLSGRFGKEKSKFSEDTASLTFNHQKKQQESLGKRYPTR